MDESALESVVTNLDRRVTNIEQILPTLVTKEDLRSAIAPLPTRQEMRESIDSAIAKAVAPLPTRQEMRESIDSAIAKAVAPLATREELREQAEQTRRHFDVVAESLRGEIRLLAEGQGTLQQRFEDLRTELKADIGKLDRRLMRLEAPRR